MNRRLYAAAGAYLTVCALALALRGHQPGAAPIAEPVIVAPVRVHGSTGEWFAETKPYCNALEVEMRQQHVPAPKTVEGAGFSAACYALAGKIERAREVIERLPSSDRSTAAGIVFEIGHPVADAGDDASAGPMMGLVVRYWPNHYMALYHAGMSEYALGHSSIARTHLRHFLELYPSQDGWRSNALEVLGRMGDG